MELLVASLVALFLLGLSDWRRAVYAALLLAVFEGALRKWVFPGEQQAVYFWKDMLLLGAYVGWALYRYRTYGTLLRPHPVNWALGLLVLITLAQAFNPLISSPLVAIFGLRSYLVYIPLMYVVPDLFEPPGALRRFVTVALLLSLVPLTLAIVQFNSPLDSPINRYVWQDEPGAVSGFGPVPRPRVTGTFSYISGHATFVTALLVVLLPIVLYDRHVLRRLALGAFLALALANVFMSGSRAPLVAAIAAIPPLVFLATRSAATQRAATPSRAPDPLGLSSSSRRRAGFIETLAVAGLVVGVVAFLAVQLVPSAYEAFLGRATGSDRIEDRILDPVLHLPEFLVSYGWSGYGVGTTHQAVAFMGGRPTTGGPPPAEAEWHRVALELGPLGFLVLLLVRLVVSGALLTALWRHPPGEERALITGALLFSLVMLPGNIVFNATASIIYWFLAGFAFLPLAHASSQMVPANRTPLAYRLPPLLAATRSRSHP